MSKVITSPVQRWAGTVTIADPLTLPQAAVIEDAIRIAFSQNPYLKWINFKEIKVIILPSLYNILGLNEIKVYLSIDEYGRSKNVISLINDVLKFFLMLIPFIKQK